MRARKLCVLLFCVVATIALVNAFGFIMWKLGGDYKQQTMYNHATIAGVKDNKPKHLDESLVSNSFHWKSIFPNVTAFSAYYDDRKVLSRPRVQVLGFERSQNLSTPYHCFLVYKNRQFCDSKRSSTLSLLATDHWTANWHGHTVPAYRPYAFTCSLPSSEIPERVAISSRKDCENLEKLPGDTVPVVNRKGTEMKTFVVCVCSPVYRVRDTGTLVATFEMNRLLGAEFFTIYAHNLPPKVLEFLRKYSRDGLAEVVENWAMGMPQPVHYYGQLLSINDCLQKNIYRAKYLVYTDLDEVIMPLHHPSWSALMKDIDKPKQGAFVFENTYLYSTERTETMTRRCDGKDLDVSLTTPRYLNFRNRSKPVRRSGIGKYITKTAVTLVPQIHKVATLARGYGSEIVSFSQALLYHYRVPYKGGRAFAPVKKRIRDTTMGRYRNKLLTAMTKRLCDGVGSG